MREITFREAVLAFLGVKEEIAAGPVKKDQKIGEYCKGADVDDCGRYFGKMLGSVCATCPN